MLRRVRTFGFHLVTLDVRQNAEVHRQIVGRTLADDGWCERPAGDRAARLREAIQGDESPVAELDAAAKRALWVFEAMEFCSHRYGRPAVGTYVVSMAHDVDDLLAVLLLARWAGLTDGATGQVPIDVAPLFESVDALGEAGAIVTRLLRDPVYRAHLAARGNRQVVMIGYADSNKSAGIVTARWLLWQAQEAMAKACTEAGVTLQIFHGRGGGVGRGARSDARARAMPAGSLRGRLRVAEQGESINDRYGLEPIALRSFEQGVSTVALVSSGIEGARPVQAHWREAMSTLADASLRSYRELVHEQAGFAEFFRMVTPVDVIERMQIGSRPVSRGGSNTVEALRPIPWIFAWSQSRHMLPGWFGAGSGLAAVIEQLGAPVLGEMYSQWPMFEALVDDVEMVLARADMGIAEFYEQLGRPEYGRFATALHREFALACEHVLAIKGCARLLDSEPTLQRSIRLRNPYVDPIHLTQVDLLGRWRETGRQDRELFEALVVSVSGISQGLQGSG